MAIETEKKLRRLTDIPVGTPVVVERALGMEEGEISADRPLRGTGGGIINNPNHIAVQLEDGVRMVEPSKVFIYDDEGDDE